MKLSARGLDLIKKHEGPAATVPYICPGGKRTIGYGHVIKPGENLRAITQKQAEQLLAQDVEYFEEAVNSLVKVPLTQNQFDALVSFALNVGAGGLGSSTLLRILNTEDYKRAAEEFTRWDKAGGEVQPGLVRRRLDERSLFLSEWV